MSDVIIETATIYEFPFEEFVIRFEDNIWYVEFIDPEIDNIILEDSDGIYFENTIKLLNYALTMNEFKNFKKIIYGK